MRIEDDVPLHKDPLVWFIAICLISCFIIMNWISKNPRQEPQNYIPREESMVRQTNVHYYPSFRYSTLACISGYSSVETCPDGKCITASGKEADKYLIACPYHIPLGSVVKIKGIGRFTCADRTAYWIQEKYGDTFDLWFGDDYEGAKEFGRKYLEVEVYN